MKSCPICHREYPEAVQFCTRDGTRLQAVAATRYCPECSQSFSAEVNRCPIHNLDLISRAHPAQSEVSHCILCNKHYPISFDSCPIHGIALKAAGFNNAESTIGVIENADAVAPLQAAAIDSEA